MGKMSVATIDAPEFINVTSINPLISKCEIKVLYVGKNRNRSLIDKNAATAIGRTLPGSPIVGYYKKSKNDYADHGEQIIFDDEGMKVNDLTKPYGFVPTDAQVWFQKFIDVDADGTEVEREYLMTVGFLWTGQYEEAQRIYESTDGNPQSMKLHEETLQGHWSKDIKSGVDFFIINDAIIHNLCILGEDVEPCFEGADITMPKLSSSFSKDSNFVTTLFTMMNELNEVLKNQEGGTSMPENTSATIELVEVENTAETVETPVVEETVEEVVENLEEISAEMDKVDETVVDENQVNTEEFTETIVNEVVEDNTSEFAKKEDEEEDKEDTETESASEDKKDEDEEEESKKKYQLLEQEYVELQNKYSALETSYNELVEFKKNIEDKQKDDLIAQFCMLSDEDKEDVIANKSNYSLDEIESKLSVICVRKRVNFDLDADNKQVDSAITYNLNDAMSDNLPAWLKAVEATKNRNQ